MSEAFYLSEGDGRFVPTESTLGPWGRAQHGAPPAALLGRAIENNHGEGMQVARIVFDILRPVPLEPLVIETRVVRPGKKVMLVEAQLMVGGEVMVRGSAWLIREAELDLPEALGAPVHPGPEGLKSLDAKSITEDPHYLHASDWRFVTGDFLTPGPATAWIRTTVPLVQGEEDSALTHVLAVADCSSGVSGALDFFKWVYINTDVSVYLNRLPLGQWICIESETVVQLSGMGLASGILWDEKGRIGTVSQSLYVAPR